MPVTIALIGVGNRGVAAHGQGAERSEKLDLIAVCDVDAARAKAAGEQLGVAYETDHRKLAQNKDLQALVTRQRNPFRQQFFFADHYGGIMDALTHEIHLALHIMGASGLKPTSVLGSVTRGTILGGGDETIEATSIIVEYAPPDGSGPVRTAMLYGSMFGIQAQNIVQVIGLKGAITSLDRKSLKITRHAGVRAPAPKDSRPPPSRRTQGLKAVKAPTPPPLRRHFVQSSSILAASRFGAVIR